MLLLFGVATSNVRFVVKMFTRIGYVNAIDDSVTSRVLPLEEVDLTVYELISISSISAIWLRDTKTDEIIWDWKR